MKGVKLRNEPESGFKILKGAFCYCLSSRSYAVSEFADILNSHWAAGPLTWQQLIHREITEAIEADCAGRRHLENHSELAGRSLLA